MKPGRIVDVIYGGTVIMLLVRYKGGKLDQVVFDHRPFSNWFEATKLNNIRQLKNMWIGVGGTMWNRTVSLPHRTRRELMEKLAS